MFTALLDFCHCDSGVQEAPLPNYDVEQNAQDRAIAGRSAIDLGRDRSLLFECNNAIFDIVYFSRKIHSNDNPQED